MCSFSLSTIIFLFSTCSSCHNIFLLYQEYMLHQLIPCLMFSLFLITVDNGRETKHDVIHSHGLVIMNGLVLVQVPRLCRVHMGTIQKHVSNIFLTEHIFFSGPVQTVKSDCCFMGPKLLGENLPKLHGKSWELDSQVPTCIRQYKEVHRGKSAVPAGTVRR